MNNTADTVGTEQHEHGMLIKTPKQLIVTVILSFILPVIIILLLVNLVTTSTDLGAGSTSQSEEAIAARIAPVANFHLVDANAPKVLKTGQQIYDSTCAACHAAGVAGAPKLGDAAAWATLWSKEGGYDALLKNALHGVGAMPAKGGNPTLDDLEIERAVVFLLNNSGQSVPEPAEPAPAEGDAK